MVKINMTQIIPTKDKLLVKVKPSDEKSPGGIILPDQVKEEKTEGVVQTMGPKVEEIQERDTIIFGRYAGDEIIIENEHYRILREVEVLAIVQK